MWEMLSEVAHVLCYFHAWNCTALIAPTSSISVDLSQILVQGDQTDLPSWNISWMAIRVERDGAVPFEIAKCEQEPHWETLEKKQRSSSYHCNIASASPWDKKILSSTKLHNYIMIHDHASVHHCLRIRQDVPERLEPDIPVDHIRLHMHSSQLTDI